ncbi:hypothetical protein D2T31_02830 [Sinirhodobacter populi]|uniref:Universal stress protein n=1 Tax=Paenirhodobacter populi TaxID=2306993 RepID=A0A443KGN1_9RHOB|nr:hypothetical protein [Sinirhodobacter populi]RWR31913.1 hypothetical protein D2T31_02830 [Sinirhodobacter populi]
MPVSILRSARAVSEARRLAPDAAVQLVHAIDIPLTFRQALLRAGTSQGEMERYRADRTARAQEELAARRRAARGAVAQTLLGSVARRALAGAACDVLVITRRQ